VPRLLILIVALLAIGGAGQANAASLLEKSIYLGGARYDNVVPPCEVALGTIARRFAHKESRYWNSSLEIVEFERVRQVAYSPWAAGTIPRRFCQAVALVSNGRRHAVHYWIGEDTGTIGASWGVEWCVAGLDRNWAYNPSCKMARP